MHRKFRSQTPPALILAASLMGCLLATVASAQRVPPPVTPPIITPPPGNSAFLIGHATGTQGYVCLPTGAGASNASWTVNAARPEATLSVSFHGRARPVINHFLSPNTSPNATAPKPLPFANATWQSALDGSKVWAQPVHSISAGSDPSCPNGGAIGCLLLQSIGSDEGPSHRSALTATTFIQRLNTKGGSAPAEGCSDSSDVGKQTLVPYSADYVFYRLHR